VTVNLKKAGVNFSWFKQRGLCAVDLVVADHHIGIIRAIHKYFQGATWQRRQTHFMCNILNKTPNGLQKKYM